MKQLDAYMDGELAGAFTMSAGGAVRFEYAPGRDEHATPLSLSMPTYTREHSGKSPLAWLDGLLPDNDKAREAIAREHGVSPRNPFSMLEHMGRDTAGAMQLVPAGEEPDDDPSQRPGGDPVDDERIADALRRAVATYETGAPPPEHAFRLSLAGAQPKIALARSAGGWYFADRGVATTHILKPDTSANAQLYALDIPERLTMMAASNLGLDVARTEPWRSPDGELRALVVERFDRRTEGKLVRRIHQEDLLQSLGLPTSKKYQREDGGPGVAAIGQLLSASLRRDDRARAAAAFFQGLVLNVAVLGTDAHAKNYSLLLEGPSARLAPLYDLVSTAGYDPGSKRRLSAMSVDGEYAFHSINADGLVKEARRLGIREEHARLLIADIVEPLGDALLDAQRALSEQDLRHPLIASTVDGIMQRSNLVITHKRNTVDRSGSDDRAALRRRSPSGTPSGGRFTRGSQDI